MAGVTATGWATPVEFTVNAFGNPETGYGFGKAETYDVAVLLKDADLTGKKVTGFRVNATAYASYLKNISGWLSGELKLKKNEEGVRVNDPDICSVPAACNDGMIEVTFGEPVEIPATGLYVGYSFTQETPEKIQPVAVAEGNTAGGFFIHSTSTQLKWADYAKKENRVSTMTVFLEGDVAADAATVTLPNKQNLSCDGNVRMPVTFYNHGSEPVRSVDYTFTVGSITGTGSWTAKEEIPGIFGRGMATSVELPAATETGESTLTFTVTAVNGKPNASLSPGAETAAEAYEFIVENRPLVEEYTGLWCGWCPRGYVALETMKQRKGDRFIAVAYHNGDPMEIVKSTPNSPSGYPSAFINRSTSVNLSHIYTTWGRYTESMPAGDVKVAVEWADEAHTAVKATATTRFLKAHSEATYRLSYILVADGLKNARWKQHNGYSGRTDLKDEMPGELGDLFISGGEDVEGLTFNDVAIAVTDYAGERGSVPEEITAGEEYSHEHVFELAGISDAVLSAPEKLRVVAVLTDGAGRFINCNSSAWMNGESFAPDLSGIIGIASDADAVEVARYTLDGRRISAPVPGVNIIRYSDGSVRKVMVAPR